MKAAFTRTYNKESHLTPYAVESAATKKKKKAAPIGEYYILSLVFPLHFEAFICFFLMPGFDSVASLIAESGKKC